MTKLGSRSIMACMLSACDSNPGNVLSGDELEGHPIAIPSAARPEQAAA